MDRNQQQTNIHTDDTRSSVSVHRDVPRSWPKSTNDYPESDRGNKCNRHYKYLPAIIALFVAAPVNAETVGGVSATASPIANSSGSVTNQAIQVLQGPYITNTYGNGIQCQGPTVNFTPYVTGSVSAQKPYEGYYDDPVYDMSDNTGAFDDNGAPIGDGILDNPGSVQFYRPVRTGQKDNYNLGIGFSATWSRPLDKKLQDQCKEAAQANIDFMRQNTANKRLDFEIARLKNCGELLQRGIRFAPGTRYASICADVQVVGKNYITPHRHTIPAPSARELPYSESAADLGAPLETQSLQTSPE
ncbi:hypothetical protein SWYG_00131 [Synechococcus phage S-IOM18]|uniref:Gp165 n=1 Tax=Synechococcus phage S-IOM18 TaxID=754039 RepID=R9TM36_9CAUD|nr:hypothetical protein SWYG_00131 [Synechococcus phage S-IOM18]AGN33641.1 hypothetical protein SWYG_00131 [Synechococcus phage S-IOM18]